MPTRLSRTFAAFAVFVAPQFAFADSVCGPGRHLASDAFACLPGDGVANRAPTSTANWGDLGAGLLIGSSVLSIVQELASQTEATDNVGEVVPDGQGQGTLSRDLNREAIHLQQQGRFAEARRAFSEAAQAAFHAGNERESEINQRNADLADALHWMKAGYEAEKGGKPTKAHIAYKLGIKAAERSGDEEIVSRLNGASETLIKSNQDDPEIQERSNCFMMNGEAVCQ